MLIIRRIYIVHHIHRITFNDTRTDCGRETRLGLRERCIL